MTQAPSPLAAEANPTWVSRMVFRKRYSFCGANADDGGHIVRVESAKPFLVDRYLLVRVYTDEGMIGNREAGPWAHRGTASHATRELREQYGGKGHTCVERRF